MYQPLLVHVWLQMNKLKNVVKCNISLNRKRKSGNELFVSQGFRSVKTIYRRGFVLKIWNPKDNWKIIMGKLVFIWLRGRSIVLRIKLCSFRGICFYKYSLAYNGMCVNSMCLFIITFRFSASNSFIFYVLAPISFLLLTPTYFFYLWLVSSSFAVGFS